jgi:hypothetical protein
MTTARTVPAAAAALALAAGATLAAHDGPPFPIVSRRLSGPYEVSIWTDPDATDDGTAGGQFWVIVDAPDRGGALPPDTRAIVTVRPLDRSGPARSGQTEPDGGEVGRQFVALLLDHEGRFAVDVAISGALGATDVSAEVDATYDLRPPPAMLVVYLMPFVLAGALWIVLLLRRYRVGDGAARSPGARTDG